MRPALPVSLSTSDLAVRRLVLRGFAQVRLGDFKNAEQEMLQAGHLCGACPLAGEVARARGVLAVATNHLDQGESYFRQSLLIAHRSNDRFLEATASLNLGWLELHRERYGDSIDWSNASLQASQPLEARQLIEVVAGNLGWAHYKMGDFEKSLAEFKQAAQQALELGSEVDRAEWLGNIGLVYAQTNQFTLAEQHYRQALALAEATNNQSQIISAFTALALLSVEQNRLDLAEQYAAKAYELSDTIEESRQRLYALLVRGQVTARSNHPSSAEEIFLKVARDPDSDAWLRWQSRNDLAKLYEQLDRIPEAETTYQEAKKAVIDARRLIRQEEFQLPFLANASGLYDDYIDFLVEHGKSEEALNEAENARAQTLAEGLGLSSKETGAGIQPVVSPQRIAEQNGATVLFYWLGTRRSYLWAVTPKRTALFKLPPEMEIASRIQRFQQAMIDGQDVLNPASEDGKQLYEMLVAPAGHLIPLNGRVIIIPDGSLNNLNFDTLLVSKPAPHFWIEDVIVSNAASLAMAASSRRSAPQSGGKLLLIGDPVSPGQNYPDLPKAALEMSAISNHFPAARRQVYARSKATPLTYLAVNPEQFSYIHFVAHGTASQLSPLDSAVVLSKASADEDSFKLHARDIIRRPLRAELVTISTCYGSGSKAYTGEGLVGLAWAFLRSGSHHVIGALWKVSDASTPRLMDRLYQELRKGRRTDDALRTAKLSLIQSEGPYRKPAYWAPFQLYVGPGFSTEKTELPVMAQRPRR